jgi:chemotaxis protein MotB
MFFTCPARLPKLLGYCCLLSACGVSRELYEQRTSELDRYKAALLRSESELAAARGRAEELQGESNELREQVSRLESDRDKLASNLSATRKEMDELRRARSQAELRGEVIRGLNERLHELIESRVLVVETRRSKMLVRISDLQLFDSGKAQLKPSGQSILRQIASALREIQDRDFLVAGHTDNNRPGKGSLFASNWELSTARAVSVVQLLPQLPESPLRPVQVPGAKEVPTPKAPTAPSS